MTKFHLRIQEPLQGRFSLRPVNLAFVFQVNCPGCFIYGIPLVGQLYERYAERVGFIGVSTAFEDFELNTPLHTQALVHSGTLVGETRKYFELRARTATYGTTVRFPVAFDRLVGPRDFLTAEHVELICGWFPQFQASSMADQEGIRKSVRDHFSGYPVIAETFTLNQLKGTPSFIIFDHEYTVLESVFGHVDGDLLEKKLATLSG